MKIAINDFKVTDDNKNKLLRVTFESTVEIGGVTFPGTYLEPTDLKYIPFDEKAYFVPATLYYKDKSKASGYGYFIPRCGMICGGLKITSAKKLQFDSKYIEAEYLYLPEGFNEESEISAVGMPNEVEWEKFYTEKAYKNVAYAFELIDKVPMDIDSDALRFEKVFSGEFDEDEEMQCTGAYKPIYMLYKVWLANLPKVGFLFYIPVEINFNSKQQRYGYALFDAQKQEVIDLHFYDNNLGQVSAMFNTETLEDCGLFKDEELFNYKILLSNC